MSWYVIANPYAGRKGEVASRTHAALTDAGLDFEIRVSSGPEHIAELVAEGRAAGVRDFACVGGDGTLHLTLNALLSSEWEEPPTLALLPAGSGSDFIRTFALPRRLEQMAPRLARPST